MSVLKATQDKVLAVLQSIAGSVEHRHTLPYLYRRPNTISSGFPESGGGGASVEVDGDSVGAPEAAATDDGDGDGDGDGDPDSDRRRPRSKTSHPSFPPALIAFEPLSHYVGFGRSRIYQLIAAGEFPQPIKVGKSSRWVKAEIDAWISKQTTSQRVGG